MTSRTNSILRDRDILCFAGGYWDYAGFQQHTMRKLAAWNRVLFVNPIGSRRAAFKAGDLKRYTAKVFNMFAQREGKGEAIPVCNPHVIPLVYNPIVQRINRRLIHRQLRAKLHALNFRDYILWVGTPTACFALDLFEPALTVYNPVDRWWAFSFVHGEKMKAYEQEVARRSDIILCTADAIRDDLLPCNPRTEVISHAVDFDHFHSALRRAETPPDIRDIRKPIIGFIGGLHDWVDLDLLHAVATRYPEASVVLIGSKSESLSRIESLANVHALGGRPFAVIPDYLKQFDVCLIPFILNDLMVAVDPTKLREYLAQGKPVVSTDLPEVRKLQDVVYIGRDRADFLDKVELALREKNPALVARRIDVARQSDWSFKLEEISRHIHAALERQRAAGTRRHPGPTGGRS